MKKVIQTFGMIFLVMLIGTGKVSYADSVEFMQRPTKWSYLDTIYDSYRKDFDSKGDLHYWFKPNCGNACNGEVADGKSRKCHFSEHCDGTDGQPYHTGMDYEWETGSKTVVAAAFGRVVRISHMNEATDHGLGNTVILKHYCVNKSDCPPNGIVYTLYAHMDSIDNSIVEGVFVKQWQQLGEIGGSGKGDPYHWQNHLHFEVKQAGTLEAPLKTDGCLVYYDKIYHNKIYDIYYGKYLDSGYGYSRKSRPEECGYYDPEWFIGRVAIRNLSDEEVANFPQDNDNDNSNGEYGLLGFGYAYVDKNEQPIPGRPDFIVNYLKLYQGGTETYQYHATDTITVNAQFANIGTANPTKDIPLRYYLSVGNKEDPHSGKGAWRRVTKNKNKPDGNIKKANLKKGKTKNESINVDLNRFSLSPGRYNIVGCADRTKDDHNGDGAIPEEHASNNCSTEAVFEVVADTTTPTDPVTPTPLQNYVDLTTNGLGFLQTPTYAGDQARFVGYIQNIGDTTPSNAIRSSYSVECPGTGRVLLTDDNTEADNLYPGNNKQEYNKSPETIPANASGSCMAYFCADYLGSVGESNEDNNCSSFSFELQPRPLPTVDFTVSDFQVLQAPVYAGDPIRLGGTVRNIGNTNSPATIESTYYAECPGTGRVRLNNDHTDVEKLYAGGGDWEQNNDVGMMPNVSGTCTISFCANDPAYVADTDPSNNCASLQLTLQPRPQPNLYFEFAIFTNGDDVITNTVKKGKPTHPKVRVCNNGQGYPAGVTTLNYGWSTGVLGVTPDYFVWFDNDHIDPSELPPGGCSEQRVNNDDFHFPGSYTGVGYAQICIEGTNTCAVTGINVTK